MELSIIGLGVESFDLSMRAFDEIMRADSVILRTEKTQSAQFLSENGIKFSSLDEVYEKSRNFDTLAKNLAAKVLEKAEHESVCYLVDGAVSEDKSAQILIKKCKTAKVFEGVSKASYYLSKLGLAPSAFSAFSAYDIDEFISPIYPVVIFDIDSVELMSQWKLKLMDEVGEEQKVHLYVDKQQKTVPIFELDRFEGYDYSTAVVIEKLPVEKRERYNFNDLVEIVKFLRAPNGCPWDRAQTKESIRKNLIEECYELADAIDLDDDDKIREEIGDVLLQAVFHAVLSEERGAFNSNDVITDECVKLVFRHSHIFGKDTATSADGALDIWDKNKQIEKGFDNPVDYVADVPKCFPALLRAKKVLKRALKFSKNDSTIENDLQALQNISKELADENNLNASDKKENLGGKLLLVAVDLLAKLDVDAEEVLAKKAQDLVDAFTNNNEDKFDFAKYLLNK